MVTALRLTYMRIATLFIALCSIFRAKSPKTNTTLNLKRVTIEMLLVAKSEVFAIFFGKGAEVGFLYFGEFYFELFNLVS